MKNLKIIAILVLVVTLGTVIFQNRSPVQAHILHLTVEMPLILLLLLTAGGGFILGLITAFFIKTTPRVEKKQQRQG